MKNLILLIVFNLLIVGCKNNKATSEDKSHNHNTTQKAEEPKKKPLSPHTETMAMIGDAHIHIDYSSPGVRGGLYLVAWLVMTMYGKLERIKLPG